MPSQIVPPLEGGPTQLLACVEGGSQQANNHWTSDSHRLRCLAVTNEVEAAASSRRVMIALVILFIVLVALWAVTSIDSIVVADEEALALLRQL